MVRFSLLVLVPFLCLCTFNSLAFGASNSIYDKFANCFLQNSITKDQISKILYSPTNASYTSVLDAYVRNLRFNTSSTKKPLIIITASTIQHVQATIICTKNLGFQLKIRSAGHDYEGISYSSTVPFIILDMFNFRSINIDVPSETAWVQTGATLGELYYRIWEKSNVLAFPAGLCPTVGIGGHISGGGYGAMLRKNGLTVDNVLDAQIVDVKGRVLDRASMGEDLFWAIKGGGAGSFGVLLAYKIKLVQVPEKVTVFEIRKTMEQNNDTIDSVLAWQNVADKIDNEMWIRLLWQPVSARAKGQRTLRVTFLGMYLGDSNKAMTVMNTKLPEVGLNKTDYIEMSWVESMLWWANYDVNTTAKEVLLDRTPQSVNFLKRKSDYVLKPIPKDRILSIFNKMVQLGKVGLVFNPYGGRMSEIPEDETPMPHRKGIICKIQYSVNWEDDDPALTNKYLDQARELYKFMTPFVSKNPRQSFLNYRDLDIGTTDNGKDNYNKGKVYGVKYFKGNFDRLVKVKTMVDPENFFWNEQSIPPLPSKASRMGSK